MIFDAVETAYTVVNANFDTKLAALVAAKGVSGTLAGAKKFKRQNAETYVELNATIRDGTEAGLGVYGLQAVTQAKSQTQRYTDTTVGADYYCRGTDPAVLAKQAELAAEALLGCIDAMWPTAEGGAGEGDKSISITMSAGYEETQTPKYEHRAVVTFTLTDRDTGL